MGTSVSIEDGGYASRLSPRARELGYAVRNLSVGDQTSMMGCMRIAGHENEMRPGDVVVWEYGLLDTLLIESLSAAEDVHAARRRAWRTLHERRVRLIVLLCAPRKYTRQRSPCEEVIVEDAVKLGVACIDTRELCAGAGTSQDEYRDDRHPRLDSPLVDAMSDAVLGQLRAFAAQRVAAGSRGVARTGGWRWLGAAELARAGGVLKSFRNSLVSVDALVLAPGQRIEIPPASRIVGVGVVSTHESGGLSCGHPGCPPASVRLPQELDYSFLLRVTRLPCVRQQVAVLASAPDYAYARGCWADYGQALSSTPGEIGIFGLLFEPVADGMQTPRWRPWERFAAYLRSGAGPRA